MPTTPLIGREREREAIGDLLLGTGVRLVTLTGPGGVGKTRLAIQVAAGVADAFAAGVAFVSLAPLADPELVAPGIARTVGVTEAGGPPLAERLQAHLRDQHLLLVLDNFEQVLAAAPLVTDLLAAAAHLKVLVTSRAPLRLSGEHEYPVPPLALPADPCHPPPVERLRRYAAVRLFSERARAITPDFQLTEATAPAVAAICARLDGLPLAIELAAARTRLLPPQALLARLEHRLAHLTGGARDLPARQQTLRSTIDWSYALLAPGEQTLFARLAVFVGGRTLEAIAAVCNAAGDLPLDVLEGMESLVSKSLLRREAGPAGEPRFVMLETIHEYARERLEAGGEAEALQDAHLAYFLTLADAAERELRGPRTAAWFERLEWEHANLRAALGRALARRDEETAVRLAGALWWFWWVHSHFAEGRRWLEAALALGAAPTAARAKALAGAGWLALQQADIARAESLLEESLALARRLADPAAIANALNALALTARYRGDHALAQVRFEECLALRRSLGDARGVGAVLGNMGQAAEERGDYARAGAWYAESLALQRSAASTVDQANMLNSLGRLAHRRCDHAQARARYEECLALARELGNRRQIAATLGSLGWAVLEQGDAAGAAPLFAEGVALCRALGLDADPAVCLVGLARVAEGRGRATAARLYGAAEAARDARGAALPYELRLKQFTYEPALAAARARLQEAGWAAAWSDGRTMSLDRALADALEETGRG